MNLTEGLLRRMVAYSTASLAAVVLCPASLQASTIGRVANARPIYGGLLPLSAAGTAPSIELRVAPAPFVPKSNRGRKLWALRQAAVENGMRLLSETELDAEMASRRGESA